MENKLLKVTISDALPGDNAMELLFNDLFKTYEYPLYTLALRLTKDDCVAKDIIQEVFLALWGMRTKLNEINNIEAYLFRMTRFKVIKYLRKVTADNSLKERIWIAMKDLTEDGSAKIEAREFQSVLVSAIEQLPAKRKQVYLLKATEGKTYKDIAHEMNISQHTVKNHLSSAAHSIRLFLETTFKVLTIIFTFYRF